MVLHGLLDVLYQSAEACPCVVPGTLVMHIAACPLERVGPWTVRREPQQRQARM